MKKILIASVIGNILLLAVVSVCGYLYVSKKVILAPKPIVAAKQNFPVATAEVGKSWDLPVVAKSKVTPLHLTITTVKKSDRITSGKTVYTTKNGKAFLIVETIVKNTGSTPLSIGPSDYVQLVSGTTEIPALYKALVSSVAPGKVYQSSMVFLVDEHTQSFIFSIGGNSGTTHVLPVSF